MFNPGERRLGFQSHNPLSKTSRRRSKLVARPRTTPERRFALTRAPKLLWRIRHHIANGL